MGLARASRPVAPPLAVSRAAPGARSRHSGDPGGRVGPRALGDRPGEEVAGRGGLEWSRLTGGRRGEEERAPQSEGRRGVGVGWGRRTVPAHRGHRDRQRPHRLGHACPQLCCSPGSVLVRVPWLSPYSVLPPPPAGCVPTAPPSAAAHFSTPHVLTRVRASPRAWRAPQPPRGSVPGAGAPVLLRWAGAFGPYTLRSQLPPARLYPTRRGA